MLQMIQEENNKQQLKENKQQLDYMYESNIIFFKFPKFLKMIGS